jgi:hypothetical protein
MDQIYRTGLQEVDVQIGAFGVAGKSISNQLSKIFLPGFLLPMYSIAHVLATIQMPLLGGIAGKHGGGGVG